MADYLLGGGPRPADPEAAAVTVLIVILVFLLAVVVTLVGMILNSIFNKGRPRSTMRSRRDAYRRGSFL
jgi:hypothetical protein